MPWRDRLRRGWLSLSGELVLVRPAPGSARVAARAGLVTLTSLGVLVALGRLDLAPYASFGAFASVYGGGRPWPGRVRQQSEAAVLLVAAVATGAVTATWSQRPWIAVPAAAAWAAAGAAAADRRGWRPPGPMFAVFAFATCAAIPTPVQAAPIVIAVAATSATLAVAVGWAETRWWPSASPGAGLPRLGADPAHLLRCAAAAGLAGAVATGLGIGRPYWATIAAVVPLSGTSVAHQVARGVHRAAGTLVGLAVAGALLTLDLSGAGVVLCIAALQAATELLVPRFYAAALVTITPLALLLVHAADPQPVGPLLRDRLVETLVGVLVGTLVVVVTRPVSRRRAWTATQAP